MYIATKSYNTIVGLYPLSYQALVFVTHSTKGSGYHPPCELKMKPPDTCNWYHSVAKGLFFPYIPK